MRVVIYIRVSTDEQATEGFSIEAQKRRLIAFAESQDWDISEIYIDDGFSAKDLNRPNMQEMLKGITSNKFDIVLVYKLDRLTRSTSDCNELLNLFERHNVKFQSCTESFETRTAAGRLFIRLVADIAQWERETIAERVKMGMEQKALEGKKPGGVYPFGYNEKGELIPNEADLIRSLRNLYMVGDGKRRYGFQSIAAYLNRIGKLRRNSNWTAATVKYTLENPFYAGIIQFGSKTSAGKYVNTRRDERYMHVVRSEGNHPPIFTKEEYFAHLDYMRRFGEYGYSQSNDYLFSGILKCGKCGGHMPGRLSTKRSRKNGEELRTPYYMCSNRHKKGSCDMPMFRQIHIEYLLSEYISSIKTEFSIIEENSKALKNAIIETDKEMDELKRELKIIQDRRKKWQYSFAEDVITLDDLKDRIQEENNHETIIRSRMTKLEEMNDSKFETEAKRLYDFDVVWKIAEDSEKLELIRSSFREITLLTEESKVKGVKNKFFPAKISNIIYN